jgi:hypothetical protein
MQIMDVKTILNSAGILVNMIGIYIVYLNSPINYFIIDASGGEDDEKQAIKANRMLKYGLLIVMFGSLLQLVSNFIHS